MFFWLLSRVKGWVPTRELGPINYVAARPLPCCCWQWSLATRATWSCSETRHNQLLPTLSSSQTVVSTRALNRFIHTMRLVLDCSRILTSPKYPVLTRTHIYTQWHAALGVIKTHIEHMSSSVLHRKQPAHRYQVYKRSRLA